jgi:hypothetical protein
MTSNKLWPATGGRLPRTPAEWKKHLDYMAERGRQLRRGAVANGANGDFNNKEKGTMTNENERIRSFVSTAGDGQATSFTPEELAAYRARVDAASLEKVRAGIKRREEREAKAKQNIADALTAAEKSRAWEAYRKAGGTEEEFEKAWPALSESIRQQKVLDAFKRPAHEPIIKGI